MGNDCHSHHILLDNFVVRHSAHQCSDQKGGHNDSAHGRERKEVKTLGKERR
jgi:hypothetical protein